MFEVFTTFSNSLFHSRKLDSARRNGNNNCRVNCSRFPGLIGSNICASLFRFTRRESFWRSSGEYCSTCLALSKDVKIVGTLESILEGNCDFQAPLKHCSCTNDWLRPLAFS